MGWKDEDAILMTLLSSRRRDGFSLQTNILIQEIHTETDGKDQEDIESGD